MLTGKELGNAIREAIKLKGVKSVEVAKHFGVTPPSIQDWMNRGVISKDKLEKLWAYFSDVVGPEHWGLTKPPTPIRTRSDTRPPWPFPELDEKSVCALPAKKRRILELAILGTASEIGVSIKKRRAA